MRPVFLVAWMVACLPVPGLAQEWKVAVIPPIVEPGASAAEFRYAGLGLRELLDQTLACHDHTVGTQSFDTWAKGYSDLSDFDGFFDGERAPTAVPDSDLTISGVLLPSVDGLSVRLRLHNHRTDTTSVGLLALDFPSLVAFRQQFLELAIEAGLPKPPEQRRQWMLWPEDTSPEALLLLGRGCYDYVVGRYYSPEASSDVSAAARGARSGMPRLDEAIDLAPRSYMALNLRGWLKLVLNERDAAIADFDGALAVNPFGVDAAQGVVQLGVPPPIGGGPSTSDWIDLFRIFSEGAGVTRGTRLDADAVVQLGGLYGRRGDICREALAYRAVALSEVGGRTNCEVLCHLGRLFLESGRYRDAETAHALALQYASPEELRPRDRAAIMNELALSHLGQSQFEAAVRGFEAVLVLTEEPEARATVLSNLALARGSLGEFDESARLYREAMQMREQRADNTGRVRTMIGLSAALRAAGKIDEALSVLRQAMEASGATPDRVMVSTLHNNLGETLRLSGDLGDAEQHCKQALALMVGARDPAGQGPPLNNLGRIRAAAHDTPGAVGFYLQALAIYRDLGNRHGESIVLGNLMDLFRGEGRTEAATLFGKLAINLNQAIRDDVRGLGKHAENSFLGTREDTYRELAEFLIEQGRLPEAQHVLDMLKEEELFAFVRRDAAAAIKGVRVNLTTGEDVAASGCQKLADEFVRAGRRRTELLAKGNLTSEEQAELDGLEATLREAERRLAAYVDALAPSASSRSGIRQQIAEERGLMEDLRELGDGVVALYTLVGEDRYRLILITPDLRKAYESKIGAAELAQKVMAFREAVGDPRRDPVPSAQELYRVILEPAAKDLAEVHARTLMWSLDGVLRYAPINALHDGSAYLVERFGSTIYTPASKARLKDEPKPTWQALGLGVSRGQAGFPPLPGAAAELRGIVRSTSDEPGVFDGLLRLDGDFTANAMRSALRRRFQLVHIASHFQFQPGSEVDSFLLLGDGERLSLADLRESANLFSGVDLLTLSACNTAMGGGNGREVDGFAMLAQRQGAKAVIATLWPVADASTQRLMRHFYTLRNDAEHRLTKAEAMRRAQLAFVRGEQAGTEVTPRPRGVGPDLVDDASGAHRPEPGKPYAHPFYWAPFVLIGNWK